MLAVDLLASIAVQNEQPHGYDRDRFGYPTDADGDGCDTRAEVLQRDTLTPAHVDAGDCTIIAGQWFSTYDGVSHGDPADVEIDHVVALKEAWDSGAWAWPDERLVAFGNDVDDERMLRAVTAAVNQDKGDADPSNWLPPSLHDVCRYVADWVAIKARWALSMDESEAGRIRNVLIEQCPGQAVEAWLPPPAAPTPVVEPVVPRSSSPPIGCDPAYPTVCIVPAPPDLDCGDVPDRRFTVLPPDPHRLDGDDADGIGCEDG